MALVVILVFLVLGLTASTSSDYVDRIYSTRFEEKIPDDIPADTLQVIITYTILERIQSNAFSHLSQCVKVDIRFNMLSSIEPGAFNGLVSLKFLYMGGRTNNLGNPQPYWFRGLFALEQLYVDNSQLTGVADMGQETFIDLGKLKILNLDNNLHSYYRSGLRQNTFSHLISLETLRLSSCFITSLKGGTFSGLKHLRILTLSYNQIKTLPTETFQGLESLQALELADNQLTSLDQAEFVVLPRPLAIDISGNPLVCDELLCWLKNENEAESITMTYGKEPTCNGKTKWDSKWSCPVIETSTAKSFSSTRVTTAENTATRGTTAENTATRGTTAKTTATKGTTAKTTATRGTTAKTTTTRGTTAKNTATWGTAAETTATGGTGAETTAGTTAGTTAETTTTRGTGSTPIHGGPTSSTDTKESDLGAKGTTWIAVAAVTSFIIGVIVTVGIVVCRQIRLRDIDNV